MAKKPVAHEWLPDQWLTLMEAVDAAVAGMRVSYIEAKANVIELIADGRLPLRCRKVQESADLGLVSWAIKTKLKRHKGQKVGNYKLSVTLQDEPMSLKSNFLAKSDGWTIDPSRIDWKAGVVLATRPTEFDQPPPNADVLLTRRVALGVMVRKTRLFAASSEDGDAKSVKAAVPKPQPKKGRQPSAKPARETKFREHALIEQLLGEVEDGSISKFGKEIIWGTQAKIEHHMRLMLTHEDVGEPSRTTLQRFVRPIMEAWRAKILADKSS